MKQTFTPDKLIQFLYKETSLTESLAIAEELERDLLLLEEYEELLEAYHELPPVQFSPSPQSISRIMMYSEQAAIQAEP